MFLTDTASMIQIQRQNDFLTARVSSDHEEEKRSRTQKFSISIRKMLMLTKIQPIIIIMQKERDAAATRNISKKNTPSSE